MFDLEVGGEEVFDVKKGTHQRRIVNFYSAIFSKCEYIFNIFMSILFND